MSDEKEPTPTPSTPVVITGLIASLIIVLALLGCCAYAWINPL